MTKLYKIGHLLGPKARLGTSNEPNSSGASAQSDRKRVDNAAEKPRIESLRRALQEHPTGFPTATMKKCLSFVTGAAFVTVPAALRAAPLQYLTGSGDKAYPVVDLTWGVLAISVIVIVAIAAILIGAIWHRPDQKPSGHSGLLPLASRSGGISWLWIGVGISSLALLLTVVWTVEVLAKVEAPARKPTVTIEVTGRQWWWQVRYLSDDVSHSFTTANEIHIPVGEPVRFRLIGGDVIHSFWVPQLGGKMDAIPGQTNETWLEARSAGTYAGQCTEYCGLQHAHMALKVIAEPAARFARWRSHQLELPSATAAAGAQDFVMHCGGCHTVRGTDAAGTLGPDLSHLMQRSTIASGSLPNDGPTLAHWISDPQSLKPGCLMQAPEISAADLAGIHAYLETLN